jgi:hypothetical protein
MKGVSYPGCEATQFKNGARPHTWVPVGSYRINGDGYLDQKVRDEPPAHKHWAAVHRLVWAAAHGEIPADHMVCFKDGRRTTVLDEITLDRLELVSRTEHIRRNHWMNSSPELRVLVPLKSAMTRGIARAKQKLEKHDEQYA